MKNIHPDDYESCVAKLTWHPDAYDSFVHEFRIKRHDGQYRWLLNTVNPRFEENGKFFGFVGTCIDITEHNRKVEELIESKLLLQNACLCIDYKPRQR